MRFHTFESTTEAGVYVATRMEQVILKHEHPVLGLATGSSPLPVYDALVGFHQDGLDLSQVISVNLDEYVGLPADHPQSYACFMQEHLWRATNITPENCHIPSGTAPDPEAECRRIDEIVAKHPIHLQLLGVGVNGHIGFNEPDTTLKSETHVVRLHEETIRSNSRFFTNAKDVPTHAITIGMQSILQAEEIVLLAFGREKADVVRRAFLGPVTTEVPASLLQLHRDVTVVLDMESASGLK